MITLKTLIGLKSATGQNPHADLVIDADGDLLGTTQTEGPYAGLTADATDDLLDTTSIDGASGGGTVSELTNTGFQTSATPIPASSSAYSVILDVHGSFSGADFPYFRLAVDGVAVTGPLAANTSSSTPIGFSFNLTDKVAHTVQIVSASDSNPAKFVTVQMG